MSNYNLTNEGGFTGEEIDDIITRFEKIPTSVHSTLTEGVELVVAKVIAAIKEKEAKNELFVLGLSTGKSIVPIYQSLVKAYQNGEVDFSNVAVVSLDEYYPIGRSDQQSRSYEIHQEFLNEVNIKPENTHIIENCIDLTSKSAFCNEYEKVIESLGGIDLILLGVGKLGQIAYNEPGTYAISKTRVVALSNAVRESLASRFYGVENTPSRAVTMGISTILSAKKVILFAWSEEKADAIYNTLEGPKDIAIPSTALQGHKDCEVVITNNVATELTRVKTPWLVGSCIWDNNKFVRKAVLWLCQKVNKPILKLSYKDYIDNSLGQLLDACGNFSDINIKVFNDLQHTITGWPGGKPNSDDSTRPAPSAPFPKKVIIFSPHPDDDVISMGGTFIRLASQGHDVHVAYETSGNIAVHDEVVLQHLDTARECGFEDIYDKYADIIANKVKGEAEPYDLRMMKGSIRRGEAKAACRFIGLNDKTNVHFLNLPFYETGSVKKGGISDADIEIVIKLLREVKPHQIYAAGDLSDPHGTHRVCIEAVLAALKEIKDDEWLKDCRLWLYRGAWQEWELDMVDMAVPLSPSEVIKKRHAIYRHLSQKDIVPFPGDDSREFWQRAEDRTQATAALYDELGMAEYQAIEVFVQYPLF
ncbi:MAG: PIG-L family deacetylase [Rikenellaceae bacterium]